MKRIQDYRKKIDYHLNNGKLSEVASLFSVIGNICSKYRKYDEALKNFKEAEHYYTIVKDFANIGQAEVLIGNCYFKLQKYDNSLKAFKKALKTFPETINWENYRNIIIKILDILINVKNVNESTLYEEIEPFFYPDTFINKNPESLNITISKISEYLYRQDNKNYAFYFLEKLKELYLKYEAEDKDEKFVNNLIGHLDILKGNKLARQNMFEKAMNNYENAINLFLIAENWDRVIVSYKVIGNMYLKNYDMREALNYYNKVINVYQKFNKLDLVSEIYVIIGELYLKEKKFEKAMVYYKKALTYYKYIKNREKIPNIYQSIANLYFIKDKFESSTEYYLKAIESFKKIKDFKSVAQNYRVRGDIYYYILQDVKNAFKNYVFVLDYYEDKNNENEVAKVYQYIGDMNFLEKNFDWALEDYAKACKFFRLANHHFFYATTLTRIATILALQNKGEQANSKFEEAKKNFKELIEINKRRYNWSYVSNSYIRIARILIMQKKFKDSFKQYEKSLKYNLESLKDYAYSEQLSKINTLFRKVFNSYISFRVFQKFLTQQVIDFFIDSIEILKNYLHWHAIATAYKNIGTLNFNAGNYNDALSYYDNAVEYYKNDNNLTQIGLVYRQIGRIYFKQDQYEKAVEYFKKSIFIHEQDEKIDELFKTTVELSKVYYIKDNLEGALDLFEDILNNFKKTENLLQYYMAYRSLGDFYAYIGKFEEALQIYSEVIEFFENKDNWNEVAFTFTTMGDLFSDQGNYTKAIECYKNAARNYRKSKAMDNVATCNEKIGNAYSKLGRQTLAIAFYDKVISPVDLKNIIWEDFFKKLKIGDIYLNQGVFDKAMRNYKEILSYNIEEWDLSAVAHRRIGTVYSLIENFNEAQEHFKKVLQYYSKTKNQEYIFRTKMNIAATYKNAREWEDAYKVYEELIKFSKIHEPNLTINYEMQSLRCQARIKENAGQIKEVAKIYNKIAQINKRKKEYWYYIFYKYIYKIFKADLTSFEGKHEKCLKQLLKLEKSLSFLYQNLLIEDYDKNFLKLITFRRKQISLYIYRENAFISDEKRNFSEASEYFKKCADLSKDIIPDTYELDFLLYKGISKHYLAHSIRLKYQDILEKSKKDLWDKEVIREKIIINYEEARNIFKEISQDLMEKYLSYEIALLEGKALEYEDRDLARQKYKMAEVFLGEIDPEKVKEFSEYYYTLRLGLRGFPIEDLFLRKQPPGEEFISPCKMDEDLVFKKYVEIEINKENVLGYINEDYTIDVKVKFEEEFLRNFISDIYYVYLVGTDQKVKFYCESGLSTHTYRFEFILKGVEKKQLKTYQIQLLKKDERLVTWKSFEQDYKEKPTDFLEFLEAEFGKNCFEQIWELINLGEFKLIHKNLENIVQNYEGENATILFHIDFFRIALEALEFNLQNDFSNMWKKFSLLNNYDFHLIPKIYQDNFENLKKKYFSINLQEILVFLKTIDKNSNLKDFHPLVLEVQEYEIFNMFKNKKWKELPNKTIQFLELIMQKTLLKKYNINSNKIDWDNISAEKINEYKQILAQEKHILVEQIYLSDKLEFLPSKTLLTTLNNHFLDYFSSNSKKIKIIKEVRNRSTHGVVLGVDEGIINSCIDLIMDLKKNYPEIYFKNPGLIKSQQEFFKEYIQFLETILLARKIDDKTYVKDTVTQISINVENLTESMTEIKDGTKIIEDIYDIFIEFRAKLYNISNKFGNKLQFLVESHFTKKLPKLIAIRFISKEDKRFLKNAMGRLQKIFVKIKRLLQLEKILVFEFQCENPECSHVFRFLFFDKTKFFKVLRIAIKVGSISNNFLNLVAQENIEFTLWIQRNKNSLIKINGDKMTLGTKITPEEAMFLYSNLFGIEDDYSKTLAEAFDLIEEESGNIKYYCKDCAPTK